MTNDSADLATVDTQLEGRFNTGFVSHKVLAGVDYKKYRLDDFQASAFPAGPLNVLNPVYGSFTPIGAPYLNRVLDQQQIGVYLQDQMKLDRFTFVLSGRQDWVDTQNFDRQGPYLSRNSGKATGRAGLIYAADYGILAVCLLRHRLQSRHRYDGGRAILHAGRSQAGGSRREVGACGVQWLHQRAPGLIFARPTP